MTETKHSINRLLNDNSHLRAASVSNKEFLEAIFGDEWELAHVSSFSDDPSNLPQEARAACWGGGYAKERLARMQRGENQYFTISRFNVDSRGRSRRQKSLFDATFVIVADDVKEKLPLEQVSRLPEPSYRLLTSADSEQWGWILEEPCSSEGRVTALVDGLLKAGLSPSGTDPGMRGVTRYVRLPGGSNTKSSRLDSEGAPFKCRLTTWTPQLMYSLECLASAFGITLPDEQELTPSKKVAAGEVCGLEHPIVGEHPIARYVTVTGGGADGWIRIDCINGAAHSDGDVSGAAIQVQPDGQIHYKCHHGHCENITGNGAINLLDKKFPGFKDDYQGHLAAVSQAGVWALVNAKIEGLYDGSDTDIDRLTESNDQAGMLNPSKYVFLKSCGSFYELATGTTLSSKAFDMYYQGVHHGTKISPSASRLFTSGMDKSTMAADGFLWSPDRLAPCTSRVINDRGRNVINEWRGLALTPLEGDVSPWLNLAEFMIPDAVLRTHVMQWLANLFLHIDRK